MNKRLYPINFCFVLSGMIIMLAMLAAPARSETYRYVDKESPLSIDILNHVAGKLPTLKIADYEFINRTVQVSALDYNVEPSMILALMEAEESYAGYPQSRLYYFNLDMGTLADNAVFPVAWFDAERVARSYVQQYGRYDEKELAIAAYFVGHQQIPGGAGVSSLPQNLKDIVSLVLTLDAEYSHFGERYGPQVVETNDDTPISSFVMPVVDYSEIEQAYIHNMREFNPGLDEETAKEIFDAISRHAEAFPRVDARLVMSLVACESSFRPDAVSHAGAEGLGQLMPFTSERFEVSDPFDIDENIEATFAYLDRELERWGGYNYSIDRVLAAYNAGPNAVQQYTDAPYHGIPPYRETQNYVPKVIGYYFLFLPAEERPEKLMSGTRFYDRLVNEYL